MEVMGLMLGQFVDDYTVKVVDVFAMPQSGTGVSVEAVDPVFQVSRSPENTRFSFNSFAQGVTRMSILRALPCLRASTWPCTTPCSLDCQRSVAELLSARCMFSVPSSPTAFHTQPCALPDKDVGHAEANWARGDGRGLVPLSPWLWVLAIWCGHQHAAGFRGAQCAPGGVKKRSHLTLISVSHLPYFCRSKYFYATPVVNVSVLSVTRWLLLRKGGGCN